MTQGDNRRYWDKLCTTDPTATKIVSIGSRRFTSIDPQYQILKFTEVFGPVGEDWVWNSVHGETPLDGDTVMAWSDVTICYHRNAEGPLHFGPIRGAALLKRKTNAGKLTYDHDAWKKATTDALTKLLSHVGANADVFMGKFDDSKYVASMKEQIAGETKGNAKKMADLIIKELNQATTMDELEIVSAKHKADFTQMKQDSMVFARRVSKAKQAKELEFTTGSKDIEPDSAEPTPTEKVNS